MSDDSNSGNNGLNLNPKTLILGALALAAAGGAGSAMGLTIEPASVTEIRVENARFKERLDLLEPIVRDCQAVVNASRLVDEPTDPEEETEEE